MKPIEFKEVNTVYAKDQPEYIPLPVYKEDSGIVTSCWKLTLMERIKILFIGNIWCSCLTFNRKLQPTLLTVNKVDVLPSDK